MRLGHRSVRRITCGRGITTVELAVGLLATLIVLTMLAWMIFLLRLDFFHVDNICADVVNAGKNGIGLQWTLSE